MATPGPDPTTPRRRRKLVRIPHPHLPHLSLTQVRVLRLFLLVGVFSVLVLYAVFRSVRFQELLRRKTELVLGQRLGRPVQIGGFDLALVPPSFIVRDVSIANDPRGLPGPCFAAAELEIRGFPYFFGRTLILPKFRVVSPTVVFEVFEDGTDNFSGLVRRKGSAGGGGGPDVQLEEAIVQRANVRFREWSARLDVLLSEAAFTARPESIGARTFLELSVRKMRLKLEENETVEGALGLKATLMPGRLKLNELHLRGPRISLDGSGGIDNLRKPAVQLFVSIETRGEELAPLFGVDLPIRGPLRLRGMFRTLDGGGFRSRASFRLSEGGFGPFPMSADGVLRVDSGGLLAHVTKADYAGGTLEATVRVERLKHPPLPVRLLLKGRGVGFESFLGDLGLAGTGLLARADVDATLTWGRGGLARADGAGTLRLAPEAGAASSVKGRHALPTSGGGPLLVSKGKILFDGMPFVPSGGARFSLGGSIEIGSWTPDLVLSAKAKDLADVQRVAENWYAAIQKEPLEPPLGLGGSGGLEARLTRSFGDPNIQGTFDVADLTLRGARFGAVQAEFAVDRNVLTLSRFAASDDAGALSLAGRIGWGGPLRGHYRFEDFTAEMDRWPLERLLTFLDFDLPMSGRVTGRLPLSGVTPALRGRAPLVWEKAEAWGQQAERIEGNLAFEGDRLRLSETTVLLGGGRARGDGEFRYDDKGYEFSLALEQVPAGALKALADAAPGLAGRITARIAGKGTVDKPEMTLKGTVEGAELDGKAIGERGRPIEVEAEAARGGWIGRLEAPGAGKLEARLAPSGEGGELLVTLDAPRLAPFGVLLGLPDDAGFDGRVSVGATLRPETGGKGWTGTGEIREVRLLAYGRTLAVPPSTTFRIEGDRVVFPRLPLEQAFGPGEPRPPVPSSATLSGSVGFSSPYQIEISVTSSVDAALFSPLAGEGSLAGRLLLDAKVAGNAGRPEISGRVVLEAVDVRPAEGTAIEGITGTLHLSPDRVTADDIHFRYSGGTVDAAGVLSLDGPRLTGLRANFHLSALKFQPMSGLRTTVSGDLRLDGDTTVRSARGEVVLDRTIYDADLNVDLTLLLSGRRPVSIAAAGPFDAVALDVRVVAPPGSIQVKNNVARLRLSGDLLLRGNVGRPVLFGQLDVEDGGRLKLRDLNYDLVAGRIVFSNPSKIEPFFDVDARTTVRTTQGDYRVRVVVTGTPTRLAPRFTSEPLLSEAQIISLLATGALPATATGGVTPGSGSASTDESVSKAARDLLTGLATEAITSRGKEFFRLDRLQLDPNYVGSTFTGPRVTIGKTFGRNFSATVAYQFGSANSRQQQVITLEYQISPNAFVQAMQDENGVYSIDLKFRQRLR